MAENMEKWPGFSFLFLVLIDFFLAAMAKNLKESLHDVGESWRDPPANVSWLIHYDNLLESDSVGLWNRFGVWHSSSGTHLHLICILMEPAQLLAWDTVEFPFPPPLSLLHPSPLESSGSKSPIKLNCDETGSILPHFIAYFIGGLIDFCRYGCSLPPAPSPPPPPAPPPPLAPLAPPRG